MNEKSVLFMFALAGRTMAQGRHLQEDEFEVIVEDAWKIAQLASDKLNPPQAVPDPLQVRPPQRINLDD